MRQELFLSCNYLVITNTTDDLVAITNLGLIKLSSAIINSINIGRSRPFVCHRALFIIQAFLK